MARSAQARSRQARAAKAPPCGLARANSFGPAIWRHARSGVRGGFEPIKPGVFEAKLIALDGGVAAEAGSGPSSVAASRFSANFVVLARASAGVFNGKSQHHHIKRFRIAAALTDALDITHASHYTANVSLNGSKNFISETLFPQKSVRIEWASSATSPPGGGPFFLRSKFLSYRGRGSPGPTR